LTAFKSDTINRIRALFAWKATTVESLTDIAEGTQADILGKDGQAIESLDTIIADLLQTLEALDGLDPSTIVHPSAIAVGATTDLTVAALAAAPDDGALALLEQFAGAGATTINDQYVASVGSSTTHFKFTDPDTTGLTINTNSGAARLILNPARYAGFKAWDTAFVDLKDDVASLIGSAAQESEVQVTALENLTQGQPCIVVTDGDTLRAAVFRGTAAPAAGESIGWPVANITSGAQGLIRFRGLATGLASLTPGVLYFVSLTSAGTWTTVSAPGVPSGTALTATTIDVSANTITGSPTGFPDELYASKLQNVLAAAGIDPLGKADASILTSGDGCWRDWGDTHWWTVEGTAGGEYGPAFTNRAYHSVRKAETDGAFYRTKEFGFVISIECPNLLEVGDQIVLSIGGAAWGATYQNGDELVLPVIGAHALQLAGGQNGSGVLHWYVTGSVDGAFANYDYDPGAPTAYSDGGLGFQIYPGGVPWRKGDRFDFDVIGAHYEYRKNGGAWSALAPVLGVPDSIGDGLSVEFVPGTSPAFVTGDVYSFRVGQPWAVSNLKSPAGPERWEWDPAAGSTPSLVIDLGSAQTVRDALIAMHTIPQGATITLQGGSVAGVYTWTEVLTWAPRVIYSEFAADHAGTRYLRLSLTVAPTGGIGWFRAGVPLTQSLQSRQRLRNVYKIDRGDAGTFQGGKTVASTISGQVEFTEGGLNETDFANLRAFLDYVKGNDDQPFVFVPNVTRPLEAYLVHVLSDDVEIVDDLSEFGANAGIERRFSATLPLQGSFQ
jgi:hypothetical protein